jgi:hypothetical protein
MGRGRRYECAHRNAGPAQSAPRRRAEGALLIRRRVLLVDEPIGAKLQSIRPRTGAAIDGVVPCHQAHPQRSSWVSARAGLATARRRGGGARCCR